VGVIQFAISMCVMPLETGLSQRLRASCRARVQDQESFSRSSLSAAFANEERWMCITPHTDSARTSAELRWCQGKPQSACLRITHDWHSTAKHTRAPVPCCWRMRPLESSTAACLDLTCPSHIFIMAAPPRTLNLERQRSRPVAACCRLPRVSDGTVTADAIVMLLHSLV